ncbi:MAG TPA: GtrA family protein [Acidimicrobiales bacterium]|nr:GtrA family protein [Acidimicrobiales bacterium]
MALNLADLTSRLRTPQGQKLVKYSAASVVSVIVSVVALLFFDGVLRWDAVVSSTLATAIATIPSYELNRKWAWGKHGKSHLWREVVPFWVLAFIGWAFSTYSVRLTEQALKSSTLPHYAKAGLDAVVYIAAFGILWIAKFIIFNRLLFIDHHAERAEPAGVDSMAA